MPEAGNREIVIRLYRDGWGRGDLDAIDSAFASRHVLHWNEQRPSVQKRTTAELKEIVLYYRAAFPDLKVTLDELVVQDDKVAVQVTFEGTHSGTYEGFQPTHKKSRFTDMQILTIKDGKIIETTLGSGGLKYFFGILDGSILQE